MKNKRGGSVLSPRTRKAGEKLLSVRKTKRLQNKFKKTQRLLNTRSHRMGNNLKVNSSNLLGNQFKYFLNPDLIDEGAAITISNPGDSASGSVVMLFKSKKTNHRYVLKVTGVIREEVVNPGRPLNFPEIECEIYKEVSKLVKKNITPHTFTLVNNLLNIRRVDLPYNNYFKFDGVNIVRPYISVLLNETSSADSEIRTLSDFIYYYVKSSPDPMKILNNILFQIIYTLEVFNRVGIMHNDLHTGNLFIVMNNNRFDRPNYRKTFKNYRFKSTDGTQYSVKLENIGYEVRIYDYDRSYKFPKPGTLFPDSKSTELMTYFKDINEYHTEQNPYFDTFKILSHLYNHHLSDLPVEFITKIRSFFNEKTLLTRGVVGTTDFLFSDRMKKYLQLGEIVNAARLREYFLINSKPIGYMKTTEEILVDLATDPKVLLHISGAEPHIPVIETYDMDGINKDLLASDRKKAMVKEFARKPANPTTRRLSTGGPGTKRQMGRRQTTRRQYTRRKSIPHVEYNIKKKRKGKVNSTNSNLLRTSGMEMGSNNVFDSDSWVSVDEFGRTENNNRTYSDPQKKLEQGAKQFYGLPQSDNNNPFV